MKQYKFKIQIMINKLNILLINQNLIRKDLLIVLDG